MNFRRSASSEDSSPVLVTKLRLKPPSDESAGVGGESSLLVSLAFYDPYHPDDPYDRYVGTVAADALSAHSAPAQDPTFCGGVGQGGLFGRFSGDGHALTAEETYSIRFPSGETLSFYYEWNATRQ